MTEISVVICCYNSAKRIIPTLQALSTQNVNFNWEIILVDNNSSDNTSRICSDFWYKLNTSIPFKIVQESEPGLSFARKKGVMEANGTLILFCDDDNHLERNYIRNAVQIMSQDKEIGALCGKNNPLFETEPPIFIQKHLSVYACGEIEEISQDLTGNKVPWGAGLVMRTGFLKKIYSLNFKSLLSDRKGKELSSGGDTEICYLVRANGLKWRYDTQLELQHSIPNDRLNKSYLEKIYSGFGKANAVIDWYYVNNVETKLQKNPKWYKVFIASIFTQLIPSLLKDGTYQKKYRMGYILQLWKDRNTFDEKRATIRAIINEMNVN